MSRRPERHVLVRALSLGLLVSQVTGCSSWRTQDAFPERVLARKSPERVRVTVADSQLVLLGPRIESDSLLGTVMAPDSGRRRVATPVALSLRDIQRIETPGFNTGRTIAVALGSLAIAAGVAVFLALGAAISASD
jgi:hypothetical protein